MIPSTSRLSRREFTVLAAVALPGCATVLSDRRIWLEGQHLLSHEVPEDAPTTAHDHEQVADVDPIQRVIDDAIETNGETAWVEVSNREKRTSGDALDSLPSYTGSGPNGTYLQKDGDVVAVHLFWQE